MEPSHVTGHQAGRRQDRDWWTLRRLYVNLTLVLTFICGLYLLLNWENVRLSSLSAVVTYRSGISAAKGTSEEKLQGKVLAFVLGIVLVMMISLLHVKFEIPIWSCTPSQHKPNTHSVASTSNSVRPEKAVEPQLSLHWDRSAPSFDEDAGNEKRVHRIRTDDVKNNNNSDLKDLNPSITVDDKKMSEDEPSKETFENIFCTMTAVDEMKDLYHSTDCHERNLKACNPCQKPNSKVIQEQGAEEDKEIKNIDNDSLARTENISTQTDKVSKPAQLIVGTMTSKPQLSDASVNTHQTQFKSVKSCGTSTSGPFMKKLRRAQRLLKDAKTKAMTESRAKISQWRAVMCKYSERLTNLSDSNDKKDRLLGYTAFNRTLSENEVKEIYSAVRSHTSARDRLQTQCKLNAALREVVESKCEVDDTVSQQNNHNASK